MIRRYTRPGMGKLFTDQKKFETWLAIEIAILEALADAGVVPAEDVKEIKAHAEVDAERIAEIEEETNHDVVAFLRNVGESVGDAARWVHLGVTSSDVGDTGWALLLKEWKGSSAGTIVTIIIGIAIVVASIVIIGYGNNLAGDGCDPNCVIEECKNGFYNNTEHAELDGVTITRCDQK